MTSKAAPPESSRASRANMWPSKMTEATIKRQLSGCANSSAATPAPLALTTLSLSGSPPGHRSGALQRTMIETMLRRLESNSASEW